MTTADDISDRAVADLFEHFSAAAVAAGHAGSGTERLTHRLTIPFAGKTMRGITIVSNLPQLPYNADPVHVVQHATLSWLYVLTAILQSKNKQAAELHQAYEWDLQLRRDASEKDQYQTFLSYLHLKTEELLDSPDPAGVLMEVISQAETAPSDRLRAKCCKTVADNGHIRRAINQLSDEHPGKDRLVLWVESHL